MRDDYSDIWLVLVPRNVLDGLLGNPTKYEKIEREDMLNAGATLISEVAAGKFDGNRFANTHVRIIPEWDPNTRSYACGKYREDLDELQEIVKDAGLSFGEDHDKKGEMIISSNPRNMRDSFLTHNRIEINAEEGYYFFKKSNPIDRIMVECLKENRDVLFSEEAKGGSQDVKFYVVEVDYREKAKLKKSQTKEDLIRRFFTLTPEKKRKIAYVMGEDIDPTINDEYINSILFNMIDNPMKLVGGIDTSTKLSELIDAEDNVLDRSVVVVKAIKYNLLENRLGVYYYSGQPMGNSIEDIEAYLLKTENADAYYVMRDAVNIRENADLKVDDPALAAKLEKQAKYSESIKAKNKADAEAKAKKLAEEEAKAKLDDIPDNTGIEDIEEPEAPIKDDGKEEPEIKELPDPLD